MRLDYTKLFLYTIASYIAVSQGVVCGVALGVFLMFLPLYIVLRVVSCVASVSVIGLIVLFVFVRMFLERVRRIEVSYGFRVPLASVGSALGLYVAISFVSAFIGSLFASALYVSQHVDLSRMYFIEMIVGALSMCVPAILLNLFVSGIVDDYRAGLEKELSFLLSWLHILEVSGIDIGRGVEYAQGSTTLRRFSYIVESSRAISREAGVPLLNLVKDRIKSLNRKVGEILENVVNAYRAYGTATSVLESLFTREIIGMEVAATKLTAVDEFIAMVAGAVAGASLTIASILMFFGGTPIPVMVIAMAMPIVVTYVALSLYASRRIPYYVALKLDLRKVVLLLGIGVAISIPLVLYLRSRGVLGLYPSIAIMIAMTVLPVGVYSYVEYSSSTKRLLYIDTLVERLAEECAIGRNPILVLEEELTKAPRFARDRLRTLIVAARLRTKVVPRTGLVCEIFAWELLSTLVVFGSMFRDAIERYRRLLSRLVSIVTAQLGGYRAILSTNLATIVSFLAIHVLGMLLYGILSYYSSYAMQFGIVSMISQSFFVALDIVLIVLPTIALLEGVLACRNPMLSLLTMALYLAITAVVLQLESTLIEWLVKGLGIAEEIPGVSPWLGP